MRRSRCAAVAAVCVAAIFCSSVAFGQQANGNMSRRRQAINQNAPVEGAMTEKQKSELTKQLRAAFMRLDANHDGKISLEEFLKVAAAAKGKDAKESADKLRDKFTLMDANSDGAVTPEEFRDAALKALQDNAQGQATTNTTTTNNNGTTSQQALRRAYHAKTAQPNTAQP